MFRLLLSGPRPTRVDFLRRCFLRSYSGQITDMLVQKLRTSSRNQYESTWKLFVDFIRIKKPEQMSENLVLEFFTHQFQQAGRKPATIRTYKSALEQPLKWGFDIQLREEVLHRHSKGNGSAETSNKDNNIIMVFEQSLIPPHIP